MRFPLVLAAASAAVALGAGLNACNTAGSGPGGSGLAETFSPDNFRRSNDTNGTQTRPDVNRAYTQPVLPTIGNRGY